MAQTSISGYFSAKKKRDDCGELAAVKRRKLTNSSRLDLPQHADNAATSPVAVTQPVKVSLKATTKKRAPRKANTSHIKGQRSLLDIAEATSKETTNATSSTHPPTSPTHPPTSPTHAPSTPLTLSTRPLRHPPTRPPTSRGAALVQLAKLKSPVKKQPVPQTRKEMVTELKSPVKKQPVPQTRKEMVTELHRLSARQLALPTKAEKEKTPVIKEFRTLEIPSPQKEPRVPAYKRYKSLAEPTSSVTPDLPLPPSYSVLEEKFRCTDTVVNMLQKRREIATVTKLKRAVQEMCRRNFEQRHLAQMRTVYPTAFTFRQEKAVPGSLAGHQLTIECLTDNPSGALQPSDLIKRRKIFHDGLVSVVKEHHRQFLLKLEPPMRIPDHELMRWHPGFALDNLPEVTEASLPQPPLKERPTGAADVLREAGMRLTPRVSSALTAATQEEEQEAMPIEAAPTDPFLRGIPQALLDKVRAKEAAKARAMITRDPLKERKLEMIARLPEFVRILRCLYVGEKKAALLWDDVVSKVCDSTLSRMASERVEAHLNYLAEIVPGWLTVLTVSKHRYIKLNKKTDVKHTLKTITLAESTLKL